VGGGALPLTMRPGVAVAVDAPDLAVPGYASRGHVCARAESGEVGDTCSVTITGEVSVVGATTGVSVVGATAGVRLVTVVGATTALSEVGSGAATVTGAVDGATATVSDDGFAGSVPIRVGGGAMWLGGAVADLAGGI